MAHTLRRHTITHHALHVPGYSLATDVAGPDWRRWRQAGLQAVDSASGAGQPVVLGGLCMGGMLAAAVASKLPRRVAGLVLMSPTFAYDGWGLSPLRHLRKFGYWSGLDRFFSVKEREPFGVKNENIRRWIARELQQKAVSAAGPSRIPLRALREADRMMARAVGFLNSQNVPLLVIHARHDEITKLDTVQRIFNALPVRDKQLVVLENSYHMVSIDNDRHEVAAAVAGFVTRVSNRAAAPEPVGTRAGAGVPDHSRFHNDFALHT